VLWEPTEWRGNAIQLFALLVALPLTHELFTVTKLTNL
jgi:hypothetical protein